MELKCKDCGKIAHVVLDGYNVGDRLFEGVYFKVVFQKNKPKVVGVDDKDKEYFSQFNQKMWLKHVQEFCDDPATEEYGDLLCPICHDSVYPTTGR